MAEARHLSLEKAERSPRADERSIEEIREDIAQRKESINQALDTLKTRIERSVDWRSKVASHPFGALGAAAVIGYSLSRLITPRRTRVERLIDAFADGLEGLNRGFRAPAAPSLTGAALGLFAQSLASYLKDNEGPVPEPVARVPVPETAPLNEFGRR